MSVPTIEKLVSKSIQFHTKAKEFKERGELEGALINFLLSADNLESALGETKNLQNIINKKQAPASKQVNDWCNDKCNDFEQVLHRLLQEIVPLQEELKKRKSFRIGSGTDNDDITNCTNVRQLILEKQDCVFFDNIVGQTEAKEALLRLFILPLAFPNLYPKRAQGVLLYGVSGTGKTSLAKAAASELQIFDNDINVLFFAPTPDKLKGKFVGETEKNIAAFFDCASQQAKQCQQQSDGKKKVISIIFFDELDSIASERGGSGSDGQIAASSVNILLQKMQGISTQDNVVVIGATNFPERIDAAVLRRFDSRIQISLPTESDKVRIVENEIDNYIRPSESRFIETTDENKTRITRTNELVCESRCVKPSMKTLYLDPEYHKWISITRKDIEMKLKEIAVVSKNKPVSQSDVATWAKKAFVKVAERAREKGIFPKISIRSIEGKQIDVYMSLNILDTMRDTDKLEFIRKQFGIQNKVLNSPDVWYSIIPDVIRIRVRGQIFFHHRLLFRKDELIFDFPINDIYISKTGSDNETQYQLLIPVPIKWQQPGVSTTTLYIVTRIFSVAELSALVTKATRNAHEKKRNTWADKFKGVLSLFTNESPNDIALEEEISAEILDILFQSSSQRSDSEKNEHDVNGIFEFDNDSSFRVVDPSTSRAMEAISKIVKERETSLEPGKGNILSQLTPGTGDSDNVYPEEQFRLFKLDDKETKGENEMQKAYAELKRNKVDSFQKKKMLISWAITRDDFDNIIPTSINQKDIDRINDFDRPQNEA